jgi:membrane associated rhomboid family serine protease
MIEGVPLAALIAAAINTGLQVFQSHRRSGTPELSVADLVRARRRPVVAAVVTAALITGALAQVVHPGTLAALRDDPSAHQWWRPFTSAFVQEGVAGAIFNIVTAAVVVALAEWLWGRSAAALIWFAGAWAPIGDLAHLVGYRVSAVDVTAYGAGSSGATYFTAGTLCAALLLRGLGRDRLLALIGPAIAVLMWVLNNDGHAVMFLAGATLGLVFAPVVYGYFSWVSWIRLPQVSSNTAVVTGPSSTGSWVNRTPNCESRANSVATSSTANDV